tara:strand:+ start:53 stop:616 length:564 start_codon:yes stop_codon:yes gene_type:complete
MIIGIAGTLGAGKGTVVEYLKSKGFGHYSSSDTLRRILAERGLPYKREHMSALANELSANQPGGVLHESYKMAQAAGNDKYILEALHRVSEGEYVQKIGGIILGIDADIETRFERISKRGDGGKDNVTFEEFKKDSEREDEGKTGSGPNIRAVMEMADYTIMNNGTVAELEAEVEKFLTKYTYGDNS